MIKRIIKRIWRSFKREKYNSEELEFIKHNTPVWANSGHPVTDNKKILVYVAYNPLRCIIETMLLAKKMEEKYHKEIIVILEGKESDARAKSEIYKSFNVSVFSNSQEYNLKQDICTFWTAFKIFIKLEHGKDILKLDYCGVSVGEELYDAILRTDVDIFTIETIKFKHFRHFYALFKNLIYCNKILETNQFDTILFTDLDYTRCALIKMAIKHNCTLYWCDSGRYVKYDKFRADKIPAAMMLSHTEWKRANSKPELKVEAERYLANRFKGTTDNQFDKEAFLNKKIYDKNELFTRFDIVNNNGKNVFVAAHVFSDVAHYGFDQIYQDYYFWLVETIRILNKKRGINVFLKIHPSSLHYKEEGMVERILAAERLDNIHLLPDDFNTASIKEIADYIVTCQGTMGLEMACFGIPVFTASKGYYSGFGIDINSSSRSEYEERLNDITQYERLPDEIQERARLLLYLLLGQYGKSRAIHSLIPDHRFGTGGDDWIYPYANQYKVINENLRNGILMKDEYYHNILKYIVRMDQFK